MTTATHDCAHRGHIWLEEDGSVFNRRRIVGNDKLIPVHCKHCDATATLKGWADK